MSHDAPRERAVDRRTLIVGGAAAVAGAAVAPTVAAAATGPAMIAATVSGNPAGDAIDVMPISSSRHVRVDGAAGAGRFDTGETVAVFLPAGSETDVDKVGAGGPVDGRAVSRLVFGKASDLRR
jgi:hypothetical protein